MSDETREAAEVAVAHEREDRVMEALRKCLMGDREIPAQHERWWRNLAREAIEAAEAGLRYSPGGEA